MTPDHVRRRVQQIRDLAHVPAMAIQAERDLYRDVLMAIADGSAMAPAQVAGMAVNAIEVAGEPPEQAQTVRRNHEPAHTQQKREESVAAATGATGPDQPHPIKSKAADLKPDEDAPERHDSAAPEHVDPHAKRTTEKPPPKPPTPVKKDATPDMEQALNK